MSAGDFISFAVVLGISFGLSFALTPLARWLGLRWGIVDVPRGRHRHPYAISKFGGLAMYSAFMVAAIVAQFLPVVRTDDKEIIRLIGLLLGGTFLFFSGCSTIAMSSARCRSMWRSCWRRLSLSCS